MTGNLHLNQLKKQAKQPQELVDMTQHYMTKRESDHQEVSINPKMIESQSSTKPKHMGKAFQINTMKSYW